MLNEASTAQNNDSYTMSSGPSVDFDILTPADADLATPAKALLIGVSGSLKITSLKGRVVTIPSVPAGLFPGGVKRVWATGTSATSIVAFY